MDEFTPPTEPSGALTPPRKPPSTAIATASPAPVPPRPDRAPLRNPPIRRLVTQTLDALDRAADSMAQALGLRSR